MNKRFNINTSFKDHVLLGAIVGVWLSLFLIFIAPFDVTDLILKVRFILLPVYGLLFFIGYVMLFPLQNYVFSKLGYWNLLLEFAFVSLLCVLLLFMMFSYYQSGYINGDFSFAAFSTSIYLPIVLVICTILFLGRWFLNKKANKHKASKIILKGDNKLDILQLNPTDIVCMSSAQNYVEVHYLLNSKLHKKLLRTTLTKMGTQVSHMTQIHRSHLVNLDHFVKWTGPNAVLVDELELPVSKNYKQQLVDLSSAHP